MADQDTMKKFLYVKVIKNKRVCTSNKGQSQSTKVQTEMKQDRVTPSLWI